MNATKTKSAKAATAATMMPANAPVDNPVCGVGGIGTGVGVAVVGAVPVEVVRLEEVEVVEEFELEGTLVKLVELGGMGEVGVGTRPRIAFAMEGNAVPAFWLTLEQSSVTESGMEA
jgi:hypothetical protein